MRRGFTIIELLVASLLLGLLVTILTMVFNQSSIAWRTGMAGVVGMNQVRENIAEVREEADNAFVWKNRLYRHTGLWNENGRLRNRACSAPDQTDAARNEPTYLNVNLSDVANLRPRNFREVSVGSGNARPVKTYTVNVKCAGPDRTFGTWDDIWSNIDDLADCY